MKSRYGVGAALALMGSVACAQSVTIYGVLDVAVEHLNKVGASGDSLTRVPSFTGTVPSRLGFRGAEDLGGGLRAGFTLESGLMLDSGGLNQGGRMFGRQAFVNLSGAWGSVMLGRQYTMLFHGLAGADILGPNIYSSSSLDSYIPNARADNAIGYMGSFSGVTVGATYSTGRDTVNAGNPGGTNCAGENASDKEACREWSAMLKYDAPAWGVALAADEMRGGTGALGLGSSALTDRRISLNGYAKVGGAKIGVGLLSRDNEGSVLTPRSDLWYVGASYPVSPTVTVDGQVFRLKYKDSANQALLVALRGTYQLSKRTAVYATAGSIDNRGTLTGSVSGGAAGPLSATTPGGSQLGVAAGVRHSF